MSIGQWVKDTAAWLTANVISPGTAASQYRDPNEAARVGAPQVATPAYQSDPMLAATLAGMNYIRNKAISQPISTAFLMSGEMSEKNLGAQPGFIFNAHNWAQTWDAAAHISPGQALGLNPDKNEYSAAVNSPLQYYKPADAVLPQGFNQLPMEQQQQMLQQAGMPVVGNQFIQQKRIDSSIFKYASGVADFAFSWEADPIVLAGKGLGRVRGTLVQPATIGQAAKHLLTGAGVDVTPLARPLPTVTGQLRSAVLGKLAPQGSEKQIGWTGQDINNLVNSSKFGRVQQFLWDNKDNPQLVNNLELARSSALGPRFGAIVSTLQTPEEVNLFLRAGLGDADAIGTLETRNAQAATAIEQDQARISALGLMRARYAQFPAMQAMIDQRMGQLQAGVNANAPLVERYNQILDHRNELDSLKATTYEMSGGGLPGTAVGRSIAQNAYTVGAGRPLVNLGLTKSRIASKFFATPVTVVRSFKNYKPNGWMDLNDLSQDSVNELRGFLARIPNITPQVRENVVNEYLTAADEGARLNVLQDVSKMGMGKIAQKYGLLPQFGEALYREDRTRMGNQLAALRQYATARVNQGGALKPVRVDAFTDEGGALAIHPNLVTRLVNSHILPDLDRYDLILKRNSSALGALALKGGDAADTLRAGADFFQQAWKFGTLFRLGYIPRVLGDDLAGQMSRLGMASMALRAGYGVKNLATNMSSMMLKPYYQASAETKRIGMQYADLELDHLNDEIAKEETWHAVYAKAGSRAYRKAQGQLTAAQKQLDLVRASGNAVPSRLQQLQDLVTQRQRQVAAMPPGVGTVPAQRIARLNDLRLHQGWLQRTRDQMAVERQAAIDAQAKVTQGSQAITINGVVLPGAFQGTRGQYYQQVISPDQSLANVFNTNKQLIHGNMMRSWDHGAVQVYPVGNEELHSQAWAHVINAQFAQDQAARRVLQDVALGQHVDQSVGNLMTWFKSAQGLAYVKRLGIKNIDDLQIANSIAHDVHEMVPLPSIASKAMEIDGVSPSFLKDAIPNPADRPDAIAPGLGENFAQVRFHRALDRVMQHWFDTVATLPANRWSRHPLFNQLYEGHAKAIMAQEANQGIVHTVADANRIAETSRRLALKDTRKLVFDIAHKSDAMGALGLIAPFFAATAEGWQRWARIVADRPEVAGYASKFFNVPLSLGVVQDQDGNTVLPNGQSYDPVQKKMVDVPMSARRIVVRVPHFLASGLPGVVFNAQNDTLNLSQASMNLVLNGDPWFNPGQGPIVTIPLNEFVKDKPSAALLARQIGALPYGPSTSTSFVGRVADQVLPATVKNFLTAYDTSDQRYQQVKMQIMQQAAFQHANFGAPMPSAAQIASRVKNYWLFSAASSFLGPVAGQRTDPYAFYRQQYNTLLRTDPTTADQNFLAKYGESYFIFAQSMSKNASGVGATLKAANLEKKYGDLISQNPDLAGLIIGPEGNGPFSPEAYTYELNNPLVPGGAEMMRTKMSAEEAMADNQKRLGWAKYTSVMNGLTAQLISRGLKTFNDPGAEDLKQQKQNYVNLYSQPLTPDGSANPYYNDAWSRDYMNYDSLKYERLIPGMTAVANSDLAKDPNRSDLQVLKRYLQQRQTLVQMLSARKAAGGSSDIKATSGLNDNSDLLASWASTVQGLIESDVNFGNLYHRYLTRDLGVDIAAIENLNQQQPQGA